MLLSNLVAYPTKKKLYANIKTITNKFWSSFFNRKINKLMENKPSSSREESQKISLPCRCKILVWEREGSLKKKWKMEKDIVLYNFF